MNAIAELELKCIVERISGYRHRENNLYRIRPVAEWDIFQIPLSPSAKHRAKRERKRALAALVTCITALRDNFDNRTNTISIIEIVTTSIIEKELDQSQPDQLTIRDGAPRYEVSFGQDHIVGTEEQKDCLAAAIKKDAPADEEYFAAIAKRAQEKKKKSGTVDSREICNF